MSLEGPNWSEELVSLFLKNVLERAEPDRKAGSKGQSSIFGKKVLERAKLTRRASQPFFKNCPRKGQTGPKGPSAGFLKKVWPWQFGPFRHFFKPTDQSFEPVWALLCGPLPGPFLENRLTGPCQDLFHKNTLTSPSSQNGPFQFGPFQDLKKRLTGLLSQFGPSQDNF